jgi:hypothetical protein
MSQIDPKWIQIDDTKLTIVEQIDGNKKTNLLSIREDIVLTGVSVEFVNESKIEVRYLAEGEPEWDGVRDRSRDFWLQIPDPV